MENVPVSEAGTAPQGEDAVPFARRWDILKPTIERLYLDENLALSAVIQTMRDDYSFDANPNSYKYQFRKWGWKRSVTSSKKEKICNAVQSRALMSKSTEATFKGRAVDVKQLRRHAKEMARKTSTFKVPGISGNAAGDFLERTMPFGNRIFLNWNLPYNAISEASPFDQPSPFGPSASTPSDVSMRSPAAASPDASSSQLMLALQRKVVVDRANLFISGKYDELLQSLNRKERRITSTWLYQYWFFSFKTAKYWGRGPRFWSSENLGFTSISTPLDLSQSPAMVTSPEQQNTTSLISEPSQFCKWAKHVDPDQIVHDDDSRTPDENAYDPDRNLSHDWPNSWQAPPLEQRLAGALENNNFSTIESDQLPIAVPQLAKAARKSPHELLIESLGFSIMGRNEEQVVTLLKRARKEGVDLSGFYPAHLAATYLDGALTCCNILGVISVKTRRHFTTWKDFRATYVNAAGHTVLDTLMMTILRNHTSTRPQQVDDNFRGMSQFAGNELDICGRWDADSECYQSLLAHGQRSIPVHWRHKFCHSSAQAIVHSIQALRARALDMNGPSGLFIKHCSYCGKKLQLSPLHTMVVVSLFLAKDGRPGEDLFGALCCILYLLTVGMDPCQEADMSLSLILDEEDEIGICHHKSITACGLAQEIWTWKRNTWGNPAKTGWILLVWVLRIARQEKVSALQMESDEEEAPTSDGPSCRDMGHYSRFSAKKQLGHVWAACQTELLTYRRLREDQSWLSPRMDLAAIANAIEQDSVVTIPLFKDGDMKSYCNGEPFYYVSGEAMP